MTSPALQEIVAVLAHPAAGNPAQYLFERALAAAGLEWQVVTCDVAQDRVAAALAGIAALGFRGCLLAGGLREEAVRLVATASPAATFAGGVGLLERTPEGFAGHMTEGRAVIEAVRTHADPSGREVLVLGAGLAGRAAALEMALAGAAGVLVADPDSERAARLASDLATTDTAPAAVLDWSDALAIPERIAIVVRTLPEPVAPTALRSDLLWAEIAAGAEPPAEAVAAGCCLVDGLEIRAAQAAIDFQTLTGLGPDVEMLREALDEYLS